MPQPLDGRVLFAVPVQVIGVSPSGTAFSETAYTIDVSRYGVRLDKVPFLRRPGDHVTLRYGERSARYRVAWVGAHGTPQAGQAGLAILEGEPFLWGSDSATAANHSPAPRPDSQNRTPASTSPRVPAAAPASTTAAAAAMPSQTGAPHARQNASQPATSPRERRATRRYICDRAVLCWKDGERVPLWGKLRDLSLGGCFIETPGAFAPGEAVSLMLMLYGYKIRARAQVRVHQPGQGMGLHFLALQPEELHKLKQVLAHLSEPSAERPGILNNENSVLRQIRSWFEQNETLTRDQFCNLLELRKSQK